MSPTTTELTPALKVTVLKHLINNRDTAFITAATGLSHNQVDEVKRDHGYPDVARMRWAADILDKKSTAIPESAYPTPRPAAQPVTHRPAVAAAPSVAASTPSYSHVLDAAKVSTKARTRNLGEKITTLLQQLETALKDETQQQKRAAAKARQDAEKKTRIAQLEAELAALKGKAGAKAKAATVTDEAPAAEVRAWARDAGVQCPANGRVPGTVREAYNTAHLPARAAS